VLHRHWLALAGFIKMAPARAPRQRHPLFASWDRHSPSNKQARTILCRSAGKPRRPTCSLPPRRPATSHPHRSPTHV